jgi:hypothetical protein
MGVRVPKLGKSTLSRYLGSDCKKQLRILLAPDTKGPGGGLSEREQLGMPAKQPPLPGLQAIAAAGDEWAASRLGELHSLMGPHVLVGTEKATKHEGKAFKPTALEDTLRTAIPGTFLAEQKFRVDATFQAAFGLTALVNTYALEFDALVPDLIEVRAPLSQIDSGASTTVQQVTPDGSLADLPGTDTRFRLRVIDIKLTSEPGPGYFAEVVYYATVLAGWLIDHGFDDRFVVSADPAIWPGSHEASALARAMATAHTSGQPLTASACIAAVHEDLEVAPVPVFVASLHHFFTDTLPEVLNTPDWTDIPFHVSGKCRGCDFLGEKRSANNQGDPDHCIPTADSTEHLSRIPFLSRGASGLLAKSGLGKVSDVAVTPPTDPAFAQHHSLRAQRSVINSRASSLATGAVAGLAPMSGTSATLPSWSDLNIYITADFDSSSAMTFVFGISAYWSEPRVFGAPLPATANRKVWNKNKALLVTNKSLFDEQRTLMQFLERIDEIFAHVKAEDAKRSGKKSTVQIYMWDDLTYRHLTRVVGRHLDAILARKDGVRLLAWLFPPEEVLGNYQTVGDPVITIVSDAVKSLLALPIPHHYSLLQTARQYHSATLDPKWATFEMPFHHEVLLSDQIPSERAHAIWAKDVRYADNVKNLQWAVNVRLQALEEVTKRLRTDLRGQLRRRAPELSTVRPPDKVSKMTTDELLLYAYTKLNAAVDAQDIARRRAMPPHEREARFSSLRLTERLRGQDRSDAFNALGIQPSASLDVYRVRDTSHQANFKPGDGFTALVPENDISVLDWSLGRYVRDRGGNPDQYSADGWTSMEAVLGAKLVEFDRDKLLAVIEMDTYRGLARKALVNDGLLDLERNVCLEKVAVDFLSGKVKDTLQAIGKTPKAIESPIAARALGQVTNPKPSQRVPVEDLIWDAPAMAADLVSRQTTGARHALEGHGRALNDDQWAAFDHALTHRLSLIWGPPGTGKSRTVTNAILGAAHDAIAGNKRLRVLVASSTYTAVDNVLDEVAREAATMLTDVEVHRIRGASRADKAVPPVRDCEVSAKGQPTSEQSALHDRLTGPAPLVTVVGGSNQQVHNLAVAAGSPTASLFDLIVIDEASQVDVANAILPLATLAEGGSVVFAGDPLQLPPITQIDAPAGAEHLVGSVYNFLSGHHRVPDQRLLRNYRSNQEIVDLARDADYPSGLVAHSHHLRMNLLNPLPAGNQAPSGWPTHLPYSADLSRLLDPEQPVTCVVYRNGLDGQSSDFEAQVVAGLAWLLSGTLADALDDEIDYDGTPKPGSTNPYSLDRLFDKGIGVVTPHRAQQSAITTLLTTAFPTVAPVKIRGAVDTVERFQGQQRDIMIASYAVGDPDTIAEEDEFLQSLNRFNVMASRARAKIIVLVSEELVQHLPMDIEVLRASSLLKAFANTRCHNAATITLGHRDGTTTVPREVTLRWA